jgi:hypothetical protein
MRRGNYYGLRVAGERIPNNAAGRLLVLTTVGHGTANVGSNSRLGGCRAARVAPAAREKVAPSRNALLPRGLLLGLLLFPLGRALLGLGDALLL